MTSLYIAKEDNSLDEEIKSIKHTDIKPLEELHKKFSTLDIDAKELDVNSAIKEIKKAREQYPLDDKLKMIDMELENRRANEAYQSTND